ncbi:MAG TPA: transposase [bacterium]|nr:transposase [bacterium]
MARPLRITYPGALYHVINRGHRKERIFRRTADREQFLERLLFVAQKYRLIVHGYCLMDNHYHLLLETTKGDLPRAMHQFQSSYANYFRVKYRLAGSVFQSRYKAVLVENDDYLLRLSVYIHLNPVRAGIVEEPADYRWSSCARYLTGEKSDLVDPTRLLERGGGVENYRAILDEIGADKPEARLIYGANSVLGDEGFFGEALQRVQKKIDPRAVPEYRKLREVSVDTIRQAICAAYGVNEERLTTRGINNEPRKAFVLLLKRHTALSLGEIGTLVKMSAAGVGMAARQFEKEVADDAGKRKRIEKLERELAR